MKPIASDHPEYYGVYISKVKHEDLMEAIKSTAAQALDLISSLDENLGDYAYAEGKWTLKEVLIHCIDTERIFSTRALAFARGEKQKALSFDENIYAPNSQAHLRTLGNISKELKSVSEATGHLFGSFSPEVLQIKGETPTGPATVNAIGFAICGHTLHHIGIIKERYLK